MAAEVQDYENGRDFLACCDVLGSSLAFGAWWHKRGTGRGGVSSFDICEEAYLQLEPKDREGFVKINSMNDVVEHLGLPGEAEVVDLNAPGDSPAVDVSEYVDAAEALVRRLLEDGRGRLSAADVIDASDDPLSLETVRYVLAKVAKTSDGWSYTRGIGDDPGECVLQLTF
eukprot:TRINITY_DN39660_c0_g1_i1.p1 TRINITY_DN39660_c0_g1~~TRINITY_DN39660_c0_g1_i1.p1  ORF type:complete len:187 (+),score=32.14 TRINITY_DN39660_c0_g1_i1:50-562(+)